MLTKTTIDKVVRYKSSLAKDDFAKELRVRINNYFKINNISHHANEEVIIKAIVGFVVWGSFYVLILSGLVSTNFWWLLLAYMGIGFSSIFLVLT